MCRWLGVSKSGFFDWKSRPASPTDERRARLATEIAREFTESEETYGYRRIHAALARRGLQASPELVRNIMRDLGLQPCQPRPWRAGLTEQAGGGHRIPDLFGRESTAEAPGDKMVGDITYINTWQGWLYLATVIDCHTKLVLGYAMGDNYKTSLISAALHHASERIDLPPFGIFHSDRGSNYTSTEFARTVTNLGLRQSVGRTGICYDNATAESFFASLKNELVHRTVYPTREHARRDITRYIEFWYNRKRLHSALGYRPPQEAHNEWINQQEAA